MLTYIAIAAIVALTALAIMALPWSEAELVRCEQAIHELPELTARMGAPNPADWHTIPTEFAALRNLAPDWPTIDATKHRV